MKRVLDVARIQLVNWPLVVAWPLGLLASVLLLNLAIFGAIGDVAPPDGRVTLGLMSIYIVVGVTHLQAMTQMFPFAVGLGVTRRAFYAATAVVVAGQALLFGIVLLLFEQVERLSGGWGLGVQFFGLGFLRQDNPVAQWLAYAVPFVAVAAVGVFTGVVFKRWGQVGIYVASLGSAVAVTGLAVLVTVRDWWPAVGVFFTGQSSFALLAGYPLVVALLLGAAGWLAIRRATP